MSRRDLAPSFYAKREAYGILGWYLSLAVIWLLGWHIDPWVWWFPLLAPLVGFLLVSLVFLIGWTCVWLGLNMEYWGWKMDLKQKQDKDLGKKPRLPVHW